MNPLPPRKILMCVSGMSPAVITETLYALVTQDEPFIPDEIHVVTTLTGKDKILTDLLTPQTGHFHRLVADYLPGRAIRFDASTVHVIRQERPSAPAMTLNHPFGGLIRDAVQPQQPALRTTELADIQTNEDNEAAANTIYREMRKLKAQPGTRLHVSVAGGRKSMSFYMGHAFSLLANVDDTLSHVLVSEPFESTKFYYPPRTPQTLSYFDRDRNQSYEVCTADARIELAELSVLKLGDFLGQDWPQKAKDSLSFAVQLAQAALGAPKLKVVLDTQGANAFGYLEVCGQTIALPPLQFTFFALHAIACKHQADLPEGAALDLKALTAEFWRDLDNVWDHHFSKASDFKGASPKIREQLRQSVGPVEKQFQIVAARSGVTGQKMLQVAPTQLELVNLNSWWKALRHDLF
jgi:CRISPR-associated protein (TIGR02584 family)